jgi:hypothetical protein
MALIAVAFAGNYYFCAILRYIGYPQETISNLWFLRAQYQLLQQYNGDAAAYSDLFPVFEMIVWLSALMVMWRIATGLHDLSGAVEYLRQRLARRRMSVVTYFALWLVVWPLSLFTAMYGAYPIFETYPETAQRALMFFWLLASTFFLGAVVAMEGAVDLICLIASQAKASQSIYERAVLLASNSRIVLGGKQVRFSIESGHGAVIEPCPRCAKSGPRKLFFSVYRTKSAIRRAHQMVSTGPRSRTPH